MRNVSASATPALIEKGVPMGAAEQSEFLPDAEELAEMTKEVDEIA